MALFTVVWPSGKGGAINGGLVMMRVVMVTMCW